jgi:hypothetical protein
MGAYQQASNYANTYSTLNPAQTSAVAAQQQAVTAQGGLLTNNFNQSNALGNAAAGGAYNTNFSGAPSSTTAGAQADLAGQMSGQPNMSVVGGMVQANNNLANQSFNQNVLNATQQVLPSINNGAFASGGYGGSRQGIAQGLALQGLGTQAGNLAQSELGSGATMYGNAYNTAQGISSTAANNMANMDTQNSQFNSTLANQNNQLSMAQNSQNLNNASLGANLATNATGTYLSGQDQLYQQQQALLAAPQTQAQSALNSYLSAVSPGASMGGVTAQSTPYYTPSPLQTAAGIGVSGAGLLAQLQPGTKP